MKTKKALALILATQMLLASLAACSKDPGTETQGTQPGGEDQTVETKLDRTTVSDELPEVTFGGKDFRFFIHEEYAYQVYSDDTSGIGVNAEIHDRNKRVEERFDVKISYLTPEIEDIAEQMAIYTAAGQHTAEILSYAQAGANLPVMWFSVLNWEEIPYLNYEKPWWNKRSIEDYTFGGNCFSISGDLALNSIQGAWCLSVNNDLMEGWGYSEDALNSLVQNGEWTLDKLIEMTSEAWIDVNGDGAKDDGDKFGFGSPLLAEQGGLENQGSEYFGTPYVPWVTALGEQVLTMNEDHMGLTNTIGTEKLMGALEKLVNFHNNTVGVTMTCVDKTFADGNIGLYTTKLDYFYRYSSDISFNLGLMPLPKYDTAQESYETLSDMVLTMFGLPLTIPKEDYDMIGIIMEALNAETWKTVYPAYYEEALKGRYSTDETMADMIDLIAESRRFEYASSCAPHFPSTGKLPRTFAVLISQNNADLASVLAEYGDHINRSCKELMAFHNLVDRELIPDPEEWCPGFTAFFGEPRFVN